MMSASLFWWINREEMGANRLSILLFGAVGRQSRVKKGSSGSQDYERK